MILGSRLGARGPWDLSVTWNMAALSGRQGFPGGIQVVSRKTSLRSGAVKKYSLTQ